MSVKLYGVSKERTKQAILSDPVIMQALTGRAGRLDSTDMANLDEMCSFLAMATSGHADIYDQHASEDELVKAVKSKKARLDAEGNFLERDLEQFDPRRYETLYRDLGYWQDLFPVVNQNDRGAIVYRYSMIDFKGEAQLLSDGSTDVPMVNAERNYYSKEVYKYGSGYFYTIDELRAHVKGGHRLTEEKVREVMHSFQQKMHKAVFNGEANTDMEGILNYSGVANNVVAPSAGANSTWASKITANEQDAVLFDIGDLVSQVRQSSEMRFGTEQNPVYIGVPLAQFDLINRTPRSNVSDTTVRQFAENNIMGLAKIVPILDLQGAGTGATDLMLAWVKNEEYLNVRITKPIEFMPMQRDGFVFKTVADMKMVGPVLRYAPAMQYVYGI